MTNSEKKAFLCQYGENEREIARLEEEIALWNAQVTKITTGYSPMPLHSAYENKMQTAVIKIIELKSELYDRLIDATELRRSIQRTVDLVEEARFRNLLTYRYIDTLKWEKISDKLHVEFRYVLRLHNKALVCLKIAQP